MPALRLIVMLACVSRRRSFFWNFRTEFSEHWSFLEAHERGWFPRNVTDFKDAGVTSACPARWYEAPPATQGWAMQLLAYAPRLAPAHVKGSSGGSVAFAPYPSVRVAFGALAVLLGAGVLLERARRKSRADPNEGDADYIDFTPIE